VQSQLDELTAREARLLAERDGANAVVFPDSLMARIDEKSVATAIAGEGKLFDARKKGRLGQQSQLRERIAQSNEEIRGLTSQQTGKERELKFITEELVGVTELYAKNLISISRMNTLQRDKARIEGEQGQYVADIARARGKISETELQILQLDQDFRTDVLKDLRETEGKIGELKERVTAAKDQLQRVDIRAPQAGIVNQMSVYTVGGVIASGETIMQIVPRADALVVEAKVAPQDIDQIAVGAVGVVRVMAGDQRTMPDLTGVLTRVSADLTHDQQNGQGGQQANQAYYLVRVSLPVEQVRRLGDLKLVPGMPAEVFIQTYARTPLQYLLKPLREQMARTFRER
jgi:HlyD family secretion protein